MKKVFLVLAISAVLAACGGNSKQGGGKDSTTAADQTAKSQESDADTNATKNGAENNSGELAPGAKLISANDCGTCHKADVKVVGPAFKDVAAKYPPTDANIDSLTNKVINGGSGHWGTVQMTAHHQVPKGDVKEMVKYILSLKK